MNPISETEAKTYTIEITLKEDSWAQLISNY